MTPLPPWLESQLHQLMQRRGHALLIEGPSGLGQYELGFAMTASLLCDAPTREIACGKCASCHLIDARSHPDLYVLMPEIDMLGLLWPLSERAQIEIDKKERKASKEIRVEALHELVKFSQRTNARGRGKVALVYPAERMNAISANALLKTLEEPAGDLRVLLVSQAGNQLLPTIRSRCQSHSLAWPKVAEGLAWLQEQGVSAQDAAIWLIASGNRAFDALVLVKTEVPAHMWSRLPQALRRGDGSTLEALFPSKPIAWVQTLQKLIHDLWARSFSFEPHFFQLEDLGKAPHASALVAWSQSLAVLATAANHPFNAGLLLEALSAQAAKYLSQDKALTLRP